MAFAPLKLKKNEDRRLRAGHLWVYSNEVDTRATPLKAFEAGQLARVQSASGHVLGTAYVNPHSLICARLISRQPDTPLDVDFFVRRLNAARRLRDAYFEQPFYRLVFGEGDRLPGLVVDRFGDTLVVQTNTAGMERVREAIVEALIRVVEPAAIVMRNDAAGREAEGLDTYVETVVGEVAETVAMEENGARFHITPLTGQKTGWYFDHRLNRARLCARVAGKRVLDLFSYAGGWSVPAAMAGAREVVAVDSSAAMLSQLQANAEANGVAGRVSTRNADVSDALRVLREAGEKFDVVVLDPPAFVKRRKDLDSGARAYLRINELAMSVLAADGLLVSASCSFHMSRDHLLRQLLKASRHIGRELQVVEQGHQGPDHPVHPAIPETEYLKAFFCRVI